MRIFIYSATWRKAAATGIIPLTAGGCPLVMGVREQCLMGRACSFFVRQGGDARASLYCRHGSQAGTLARSYTHAGTSVHATRAEDIGAVLFQGVGFMTCVYLSFRNIALWSGNRNRSINRRGGARSRWK